MIMNYFHRLGTENSLRSIKFAVALSLVVQVFTVTSAWAVNSGYLPRDKPYVAPKYIPTSSWTQDTPDWQRWWHSDRREWFGVDSKDSYADLRKCLNWHQSNDYVSTLNQNKFAGHSDWRMPSLMELVGIYDDTREVVMGHDGSTEYTMRTDPQFAKGQPIGTGLQTRSSQSSPTVVQNFLFCYRDYFYPPV